MKYTVIVPRITTDYVETEVIADSPVDALTDVINSLYRDPEILRASRHKRSTIYFDTASIITELAD